MAGVIQKFLLVSIFMWIFPTAILYGLNNDLFPGKRRWFFVWFLLRCSPILIPFSLIGCRNLVVDPYDTISRLDSFQYSCVYEDPLVSSVFQLWSADLFSFWFQGLVWWDHSLHLFNSVDDWIHQMMQCILWGIWERASFQREQQILGIFSFYKHSFMWIL